MHEPVEIMNNPDFEPTENENDPVSYQNETVKNSEIQVYKVY